MITEAALSWITNEILTKSNGNIENKIKLALKTSENWY